VPLAGAVEVVVAVDVCGVVVVAVDRCSSLAIPTIIES
jgi:hypothetical protein